MYVRCACVANASIYVWLVKKVRLHHLPSIHIQSPYPNQCCIGFTYPDTVQHSMDNIFHVVQLVHPKYPIQHSDRIRVNRCPVQLYYCHLSFDLCALNQSKVYPWKQQYRSFMMPFKRKFDNIPKIEGEKKRERKRYSS